MDFESEYPDPRYAILEAGHSFYRIAYWKDGVRCFDPNEWDRCTVTPTGMFTYGEQTFTRDEAGKIQALITFLDRAFISGGMHVKEEIRQMLGVKG